MSNSNPARKRFLVISSMGLLLLLIWYVIVSGLLIRSLVENPTELQQLLISKGSFCFALVVFIAVTKTFAPLRINVWGKPGSAFSALPLLLFGLFLAIAPDATWSLSFALSFAWILVALFVAFGEEVVFRGYLQTAFGQTNLWRGAFLSSLLFGAVHLLGLLSPLPTEVILAQSFFAFSVGLMLAAVRIGSSGLALPIAIHAVFDATAFLASGGASSALAGSPDAAMRILIPGICFLFWGIFALALTIKRANRRV